MSHVPPVLPKAGSAPWKQLWEETKQTLDLPRTMLVIEGALDRKTLEEILAKLLKGKGPRPGQVPRQELVGGAAELYHGNAEAAYALMRELDKSAMKERSIVASIEESAIDERLATYRAIDFRRERARMIWALMRDGREAHRKSADKVLLDAFTQIQKAADAHAVAESAAPSVEGLGDLKQRLTSYEEAIVEQQKEIQRTNTMKESAERERGELIVRLGQRERALREEEEVRRVVEVQLERVKAELLDVRRALEQSQPARLSSTLEELDRLREKNRALEARAERAERLSELEAALDDEKRAREADKRSFERAREDVEEQARLIAEREAAALEKCAQLREELKAARRQLAGESERDDVVEGKARVGVFVDAANLSASAKRDFGSKLDYRAVLAEILEGRAKACAVAFVVKDGDENMHTGFVHNLRDGGYEIREKRPKHRHDGSRKADWDMGIAMEILDRLDAVDIVVLCSGDGDFVPLVQRLKREGKRVEVAAFRAATDDALIKAADSFVSLDGRFRMTT
jgi:uncharacterized LabA/DUF88 family protein